MVSSVEDLGPLAAACVWLMSTDIVPWPAALRLLWISGLAPSTATHGRNTGKHWNVTKNDHPALIRVAGVNPADVSPRDAWLIFASFTPLSARLPEFLQSGVVFSCGTAL